MKHFIYIFLVSILTLSGTKHSYAQTEIKTSIKSIIENKNLELGFAIFNLDTEKHCDINGNDRFPMQSVYKFPIVLALLNQTDKGLLALYDTLAIDKKSLHPNTWSPLRDNFPNGVNITVAELIKYVIKLSDNNGSDIALDLAGGAEAVQHYLNTLGIRGVKVRNSEFEIQSSWNVQYDNWAKPKEIIDLLGLFYNREILKPQSYDYLWNLMEDTKTGSIRKLLPSNALVAYKTGYSGVGKDGIIAAQNCVGIMRTIDGSMVAFAIFITNSKESDATNYSVIAEIGAEIYALKKIDN